MTANELMIGDWVYNKNIDKPMQVYPQMLPQMFRRTPNATTEDYNIYPVPITPEILEKNGFGSLDESGVSYRIDAAKRISLSVLGKDAYIDDMDARYVHQLQHALRLCGINKEIVL